ncbi:Phospholipid/glycerol acyltransferase domain-containing protein [Aphelenchoides bicaudatus]|nr:Phospholipid/glycerol acyltransferase domain-containing protein [Aphelenchoides bicaudatus]
MFGYFVLNLLMFIVSFVVLLSLTGKSTGIRRFFVWLLVHILEWISRQQDEQERLDEIEDNTTRDEIENVGSGGLEHEENRLSAFERKKRRRTSALVSRKWSALINHKLYSDVETDTEADALDLQIEETLAKVIVNNSLEFMAAGIEAIVEDDVTSRFSAAQLASWNLLTRSRTFVRLNWKVKVLYAIGFALRYGILLPIRFTLFVFASALLLIGALLLGCIPNERWRKLLYKHLMKMCLRVMSTAFSSIIYFHDRQNKPKSGIVVANHTSPIDVLILGTDCSYAMIGQKHGGILGLMQKALSKCAHHIWFERTESRDRTAVRTALQEHVKDPDKLPILIFPEGTCINNTSVMLFKKGSFEVADVVYPIALKYDNRLGDAFWNSNEQSIFTYIISIMTSWALICEVWYLPPVRRREYEDPVDFARRVKKLIAKKGGLVDLDWDGNLKRSKVPDRLRDVQKNRFYAYLSKTKNLLSAPDANTGLKNIKSMPNMNMDRLNNELICTRG